MFIQNLLVFWCLGHSLRTIRPSAKNTPLQQLTKHSKPTRDLNTPDARMKCIKHAAKLHLAKRKK